MQIPAKEVDRIILAFKILERQEAKRMRNKKNLLIAARTEDFLAWLRAFNNDFNILQKRLTPRRESVQDGSDRHE